MYELGCRLVIQESIALPNAPTAISTAPFPSKSPRPAVYRLTIYISAIEIRVSPNCSELESFVTSSGIEVVLPAASK